MSLARHSALEGVGAATWRCYGAALALRRAGGAWPEPETLRRLAESEGGDYHALLVLTRNVLPAADDPVALVPLSEPRGLHGTALVPTVAALWAVVLRGQRVLARLQAPWGREIPRGRVESWARSWTLCEESDDDDHPEPLRHAQASARDALLPD